MALARHHLCNAVILCVKRSYRIISYINRGFHYVHSYPYTVYTQRIRSELLVEPLVLFGKVILLRAYYFATRMARKRGKSSSSGGDTNGGDASFVIDTQGDTNDAGVVLTDAGDSSALPPAAESASGAFAGVMLPGHVEVVGDDGGERSHVADTSGDYEQLDAAAGSRYYDADDSDRPRTVCTVCGEFGHDKKKCPHTHCLACGAVDEHLTRNCPLGTTCFRCGGVGHRAVSCPRPRTDGRRFCDRCGSHSHPAASCPTLWRIYTYCTPEEHAKQRARKAYAAARREARRAARRNAPRRSGWAAAVVEGSDLSSSDSGEEETPADWDPAHMWCYNCAAGNHWGDDCHLRRANPTRPTGEPSAFSKLMAESGPFQRGSVSAPLPPRRGAPSPRGHSRKRTAPSDMDREVAADDWFSRRQALSRQWPADTEEAPAGRTLKERLGGWASQARDALRPRKVRRSAGRGRGRAPFMPQYRGGYS